MVNEVILRHCNMCLDEAISETENGVISEVDLGQVTKTPHTCVRCGHAYCREFHASPVDQENQCLACLPLESIAVQTEPLKTDDGVTHRGKHLIPTGPHYRTLPAAIGDMSDADLEKFITDTARIIHETEQVQDYRRIGLSTARLEKAEREDAKLRQARALQVGLPKKSRIAITGQKGSGTKSTALADFAAFLTFAKEQLAKKRQQASANAAPKAGAAPAVGGGAATVQSPAKAEAPAEDSRSKEIEELLGDK